MKIRTEVTKIEHKIVTENNEIHHLWQAWLSMKGKSSTGKIRNEKGDITIGTTEIKIIRKYHEINEYLKIHNNKNY